MKGRSALEEQAPARAFCGTGRPCAPRLTAIFLPRTQPALQAWPLNQSEQGDSDAFFYGP